MKTGAVPLDFASDGQTGVPLGRVWPVGALCRAIADVLEARFNPIAVQGEVMGFSRAASGHCYFTLKDAQGQIRCAMFRRAAVYLDFTPRDGEQVQLQGRLGVYEARGELQLIVDVMTRVGQGALFEQFLQRKAKLEAEGLFDAERKRAFPAMPRVIGLVTSVGAAALHDVVTTLQRRAGHVRVVLAPALVQGSGAPAELIAALHRLYAMGDIEGILLVRGGGSLEDLWAFNDEALVRTVAQSPVPLIAGIGHETDFSLVDFCADIRAPTPTAAAEMVTQDRAVWLSTLDALQDLLIRAALRPVDRHSQRLDGLAARLGRPSHLVTRHQMQLGLLSQRLHQCFQTLLLRKKEHIIQTEIAGKVNLKRYILNQKNTLNALEHRLAGVNPSTVLQRGYAWVTDDKGRAITRTRQAKVGQALQVQMKDGVLGVTVGHQSAHLL